MGTPENYYEAPREGPAFPVPEVLPETFAGKFSLALRLFFGTLPLILAVVLTIWIPLNSLTNAVLVQGQAPADVTLSFRMGNLTEGIFGPIVAGALIWVVRQRATGNRPRYLESMRAGFRSWGAIFRVRFVAGLFILLGFIALIIPGIRFLVRFALIDQVAAVENPGQSLARARSSELVRGRFWEFFFVLILNFAIEILAIIGIAVIEVFDAYGILATPGGGVVTACIIDMVGAFPTCLLTVYYLEAASRKPPDKAGLDWSQASHDVETEIGHAETL